MANPNPPIPLPRPVTRTLPQVSLAEAFICGGLAGCAAVTVSNIPEVMKTRLQLQGELLKSSDAPKVYKNVFDVFRKTWANEGLRGLQRGLGPAAGWWKRGREASARDCRVESSQIGASGGSRTPEGASRPVNAAQAVNTRQLHALYLVLNLLLHTRALVPAFLSNLPGVPTHDLSQPVDSAERITTRQASSSFSARMLADNYPHLASNAIGFYEPIRKQINKLAGYKPSDQLVWTSVSAGAGSGIIGATLGNPLFLIKARMQAYSPALPVGAQHHYRSSIHALTSVVQNEGKLGLIRGVGSAMLRTAMGSSVQLPSYNYAKRLLTTNGFTAENSYWTYLASSSFSGICVAPHAFLSVADGSVL
ncbi:hypothetical protein QFC24_000021 [Naganishia onofrii]|uniref:Uncharacterized protein n=1 Tax=Naganishia onofrii TaxID=1851511 RepID=A0ACC2XV28_9TREE|nr:hypothetical protein QFC24_000021 [Naganishia onofrii]